MADLILSHTFKSVNFNLPLVTDKFYLLDLTYFCLGELLRHKQFGDKGAWVWGDDLYDYVESVLEFEDLDLLPLIVDKVSTICMTVLNSDIFNYLNGYEKEIIDVEYRYVREEKYVKFFIRFADIQ